MLTPVIGIHYVPVSLASLCSPFANRGRPRALTPQRPSSRPLPLPPSPKIHRKLLEGLQRANFGHTLTTMEASVTSATSGRVLSQDGRRSRAQVAHNHANPSCYLSQCARLRHATRWLKVCSVRSIARFLKSNEQESTCTCKTHRPSKNPVHRCHYTHRANSAQPLVDSGSAELSSFQIRDDTSGGGSSKRFLSARSVRLVQPVRRGGVLHVGRMSLSVRDKCGEGRERNIALK